MPRGYRIVYIVRLYLHFLCRFMSLFLFQHSFDVKMASQQILAVRVDLEVIAMEGNFILPRNPEPKPRHHIQLCTVFRMPLQLFWERSYLSEVDQVSLFYVTPSVRV